MAASPQEPHAAGSLNPRLDLGSGHRGVVVIQVPKDNRKAVADTLYAKFGIAASTTGGLRLRPHVYNTHAPIRRAIDGVASMREMIRI